MISCLPKVSQAAQATYQHDRTAILETMAIRTSVCVAMNRLPFWIRASPMGPVAVEDCLGY